MYRKYLQPQSLTWWFGRGSWRCLKTSDIITTRNCRGFTTSPNQNSTVHGQSHFIFSSLIKFHVDKQHVNMTKASHSQTVFSLTVVSGLICVAVDPCFVIQSQTQSRARPTNHVCFLYAELSQLQRWPVVFSFVGPPG